MPPCRQLWRRFGVVFPLLYKPFGGMLRERTLFDNLGWGKGEGDLSGCAQNFNMKVTREVEGGRQGPSVKRKVHEVSVACGV
jgi:hypothetical protein